VSVCKKNFLEDASKVTRGEERGRGRNGGSEDKDRDRGDGDGGDGILSGQ